VDGSVRGVRTVFGRPALLVPLGAVLLLVGILVALDGIGSFRTGAAVDDAQMCADSDSAVCLERVDVRLKGPVLTRRATGHDFTVRTVDGDYLGRISVDDDEDSDRLEEVVTNTVTAWVKGDDPDEVVAVELPDGTVVSTLWIGLRGLTAHLAFGLLGFGVGSGLLVTGLRFRRAGTPWLSADERTPVGASAAALFVVPAGVVVLLLRLGITPVVVLVALGLALGSILAGIALSVGRRA